MMYSVVKSKASSSNEGNGSGDEDDGGVNDEGEEEPLELLNGEILEADASNLPAELYRSQCKVEVMHS